jgi:diguanylate cyclase (GGDEF)-like protein
MAQLVFIDGRQMGNSVVLEASNTVGRSRGNSIVLSEPSVMERHALLTLSAGSYRVSKADAHARLAVNGREVTDQTLKHGDILSFGDVTLLFSEEAPRPEPTPEAVPTVHSRVQSFPSPEAAVTELRKGHRGREHLETLLRVGTALNASLKASDLVHELLMSLGEVFKPDRCFILISDERGELQVVGERLSERIRQQGAVRLSRTILAEAVQRREVISTENALQDPRFSQGNSVSDQRIHSALCAPMVAHDAVVGALYLDVIADRNPFDRDELGLLSAIGNQAAVAFRNAQNHHREVAHGRTLRRLGESTRKVTASLSQDMVIHEAVEQACRIFECQKASVLLLDERGEHLTVAGSNCLDRKIWPSVKIRPGEGHAGRVFKEGAPLLVNEAEVRHGRGYETASFVIAPIVAQGMGLEAETRPIGVLSVTDKTTKGAFTAIDQELLAIFAQQVGAALQNARLYERATIDPLTRLYNRQYFNFRLEEEVKEHLSKSASLSLLMADLDHFKDKNDVYGHPVGDVILAEAAALLRERVPEGGLWARYGGEEFVALFPGTALDRARDLAQDVRMSVESFEFNAGSETLHCTLSIGVAVLQPGESAEQLVKRADQALYFAKHAGRNRVEVAKPLA